eukprot:XP_001695325.1 predicted protein [Chlamydomonas reinhardtii]
MNAATWRSHHWDWDAWLTVMWRTYTYRVKAMLLERLVAQHRSRLTHATCVGLVGVQPQYRRRTVRRKPDTVCSFEAGFVVTVNDCDCYQRGYDNARGGRVGLFCLSAGKARQVDGRWSAAS